MALTATERQIAAAALLAACCFLFVGWLALQFDAIGELDSIVAVWMQSLRSHWLDTAMLTITMAGDSRVLLLFALALVAILLYLRVWGLVVFCTSTMLGNVFVVSGLKQWVQRARPVGLSSGADSYSFPSAHITMSTVVFGIAVLLIASGLSRGGRNLAYAGLVLVLLAIGLSRVYLQVHWTTDVVAGALLGVITLLAMLFVLERSEYVLPGTLLALLLLPAFLITYLIYLYTAFATVSTFYFSGSTL